MARKRLGIILSIIVLVFALTNGASLHAQSHSGPDFIGKWVYTFKNGRMDYVLIRRDGVFEEYVDEAEQTWYGKYHVVKDTLITVSDSVKFPEGEPVGPIVSKYLVSQGLLRPVFVKVGDQPAKQLFDSAFVFKRQTEKKQTPPGK